MAKELTPIRVKSPLFNISRPQVYLCEWRGKDRIVRYDGQCIGCGARVYSMDDGENDPRGVLGERHACSDVEVSLCSPGEFPADSRPLPACFECMNEEPRYRLVMERARNIWRKEAAARGEEAPPAEKEPAGGDTRDGPQDT